MKKFGQKINEIEQKDNSKISFDDIKLLKENGVSDIFISKEYPKVIMVEYNDGESSYFSKKGEIVKGKYLENSFFRGIKESNDGNIIGKTITSDNSGLEKETFYYDMKEINKGNILSLDNKVVIIEENFFSNILKIFEKEFDYYDEIDDSFLKYKFDSNGSKIYYIEKRFLDKLKTSTINEVNKIFETNENGDKILKTKEVFYFNGLKINEGFGFHGLSDKKGMVEINDNIYYTQILDNDKINVFRNDKLLVSNVPKHILNGEDFYFFNVNNKKLFIIPTGSLKDDNNDYKYGYKIFNQENGLLINELYFGDKLKSFKEDENGNYLCGFNDYSKEISIINGKKIGKYKCFEQGSIGSIPTNYTINGKYYTNNRKDLLFCQTNDKNNSRGYYFENGFNNILDIYKNGELYIKIEKNNDEIFNKDNKGNLYLIGKNKDNVCCLWKNYEEFKKLDGIESLNEIESIEIKDNGDVDIIKDLKYNTKFDIEL